MGKEIPTVRETRRGMVSQINLYNGNPELKNKLISLIAPVSITEWINLSKARNSIVHASYKNSVSTFRLMEIAQEEIPKLIDRIHSLIEEVTFKSKG